MFSSDNKIWRFPSLCHLTDSRFTTFTTSTISTLTRTTTTEVLGIPVFASPGQGPVRSLKFDYIWQDGMSSFKGWMFCKLKNPKVVVGIFLVSFWIDGWKWVILPGQIASQPLSNMLRFFAMTAYVSVPWLILSPQDQSRLPLWKAILSVQWLDVSSQTVFVYPTCMA